MGYDNRGHHQGIALKRGEMVGVIGTVAIDKSSLSRMLPIARICTLRAMSEWEDVEENLKVAYAQKGKNGQGAGSIHVLTYLKLLALEGRLGSHVQA